MGINLAHFISSNDLVINMDQDKIEINWANYSKTWIALALAKMKIKFHDLSFKF